MIADTNDDRAASSPAPQHDSDRASERDASALHASARHAALDLYARKIAHDLNNFATVIRTYSELLLSELPADGGTHADVSEIHRAADAMIAYVQRVARFARAGSMRVNPIDSMPYSRMSWRHFRRVSGQYTWTAARVYRSPLSRPIRTGWPRCCAS